MIGRCVDSGRSISTLEGTKKMKEGYTYGGKRATVETAKGKIGCLLQTPNGSLSFRIYSEDRKKFTDYDFRHYDLQVQIVDNDAVFYNFEDETTPVLDYSPDALGKEKLPQSPNSSHR